MHNMDLVQCLCSSHRSTQSTVPNGVCHTLKAARIGDSIINSEPRDACKEGGGAEGGNLFVLVQFGRAK